MSFIPLSNIATSLQEHKKYWIAFTGDSITSCEWVHPNWRDIVIYVLHCEVTTLFNGNWKPVEWGVKGFNFAYDGATTRDIVEHLDDIKLIQPQLVIGLMGGNDPTLGVTVEQSVHNISQIIQEVTQTGSQVVWCNSTPAAKGAAKNEQYAPYATAFLTIPASERFFPIDMFTHYQQFPTEKFFTFLSEPNPIERVKEGDIDQQHPNQLGNAYIAKVILKEVFDIEFDPDTYINDVWDGKKLPAY